MEIIDRIKVLAPTAATQQLEALIELCKEEAVSYCNLVAYNTSLDVSVVYMVLEKYNKLHTEGLSSSSASDISEHYLENYSAQVLSGLNKYRKLKVV